jgi:methylase of polypeptide subunit release factors
MRALLDLGRALRDDGYEFVTVTPQTHQFVRMRAERLGQSARNLRDVFGWSRPFERSVLRPNLFELLQAADAIERDGDHFRSRVRFSSLHGRLFVHSSFPTIDADAVFFGPDTYRFCSLLARWAPVAARAIDLGCGSGAGGIVLPDRAQHVVLADINSRALAYAEVNAALASQTPQIVQSDLLDAIDGAFDLVVANPPYMRDSVGRTYRDGGGSHGEALSVRIVRESLQRLTSGGTLIVYTGAAIIDGVDQFQPSFAVTYESIDPDVFGDELAQPAYAEVERIAAVGLKVCVSEAR